MNIIFVLIPLALLLVITAVAAFYWAISREQFDDLDRQGSAILFDDEPPQPQTKTGSGATPAAASAEPERP
ncbi:MAG: cbb3-type cytochrome oxidase assembly protein CcoS [Aeromonas sp.]